MDTIFIWLVAGAVISLLGIFLAASERELKSKRHELEELKNQLAGGSAPVISDPPTEFIPQDNGESAKLLARNEELSQEVSSLSKKLEASENRLEQLETLRAHLNSKESEITELRWDHERLQTELATLKTQLESNHSHADESHVDEANSSSQKDAEIAALKEQLEASQAKIRGLESTPAQVEDTESHQKAFEELQKSLEVSALQLQTALAAEQEKQNALEAIQMQLADLQERHQEVSDANIRLREESSQHQQKLNNQNQLQVERLVILRQRLEALRSKQAEVSQQEHLIQEEIVSMTQLLDVAPESLRPEPSNEIHEDRHDGLEFIGENASKDEPSYVDVLEQSPPEPSGAKQGYIFHNDSVDTTNEVLSQPSHHDPTSLPAAISGGPVTSALAQPDLTKKKGRFGIFPAAMGVLLVGGIVAGNFLLKEQTPSDTPRPSSGSEATPITKSQSKPEGGEPKEPRSSNKAVKTSPAESRIAGTSERAATTAVASPAKASPTIWERYEIVEPTRVFSAPSEHSQLVANIDPGTQVNVVDSRNGWLEIRSKHGRPPGFIPKASAVRIKQN
jgi:hypothetical protein